MSTISDAEAKARISRNLSRMLAARGWSQRDLARLTSESDMTISRVVRGVHVPGVALLARIADALSCSVDELLEKKARRTVLAKR